MKDILDVLAQYGLQGICLGMMFYLCYSSISKLTMVINKLDRTIMQLCIQQLKDKDDNFK